MIEDVFSLAMNELMGDWNMDDGSTKSFNHKRFTGLGPTYSLSCSFFFSFCLFRVY